MDDDMNLERLSTMAVRYVARTVAVLVFALAALGVGYVGTALAAAPELSIAQPLDGSSTKDSTPTFSGVSNNTTDAITLEIYAGASVSGSPVQSAIELVPNEIASGEASWELTAEALEPGQYTAVARQTNTLSETGASNPVTFTIEAPDTTPPDVSLNAVTSPSNDRTPTLSGAAGVEPGDEPSVTVTIHEGGSLTGKTVVTGPATVNGSSWSYAAPSLADGTYTAQVAQRDEAGNEGKSGAVTFTIDTTPPAVTIKSMPASIKEAEPTLSGAAGVAAGDEGSVTVTIHQGDSVTGAIAASGVVTVSGGAWTYKSSTLAEGTYTAQASQRDQAGNEGLSAAITFRVDTTAPAVTLNPLSSPTKEAAPTFTGAAGTAPGDLSSVTVTIHEGSTVSGKTIASGGATLNGATWSYSAPRLADGTYTAQATQSDEAGNKGTSAADTFRVDTTAPVVTIKALTALSRETEPTLSGNAGTALGDEPSVTVTIYSGTSAAGTVAESASVPVSGGTWSYHSAHLADGTYTAQAAQLDEAGNEGHSSTTTFTIDTTAPAVGMETLKTPTNDATPTLSGPAGVASGDHPSVTVTIYEGASVAGPVAAGGTASASVSVKGGRWSYTAPHLEDGTYTAQAFQTDEVGNIGTSTPVTFRVDTTAPTPSIEPVPSPTKAAEPQIKGAAGVALGDEPNVTVKVYAGTSVGGTVAAEGTPAVSGGAWTFTPSRLAEGTYTAQVTQRDEAGNEGHSAAVTFKVDVTAPAISLTTPANGDELANSRPTFGGLAGHAEGDIASVTLNIYEGSSTSGTPIANEPSPIKPGGGGAWSSASTALPNGEYTAIAEQEDEAGNVGRSAPVTFRVHAVLSLETTTFTHRAAGLFTGPGPSFAGIAVVPKTGTASVSVKVYPGSVPSGAPAGEANASVGESGGWTTGSIAALAPGLYTVQAEQEVSAGSHLVSAPITFTVDAQAPQVTLGAPSAGSSLPVGSQTVSGSAGDAEGDLPTVTVRLYGGSGTGGTPQQTVTAQAAGASWSVSLAALTPGAYTVQAEQSDDVGNAGRSEAVSFTVAEPQSPPSVAPPSPPAAAFRWIPSAPHTGEPVTLISTSTDVSGPIVGFAWSPTGNGVFAPGEGSLTTTFATPGAHVVQLQVTGQVGGSSTVAETIPVSAPPASLMQPFPVVRMAGSYNASGAKISLLSVLAPVGASVTITCHGPHCPTRSQAFTAAAGPKVKAGTAQIVFKRFERSLRAGVVLEIWVAKHGEIGKFTRFTIHRGKSPSRVDECLNPTGNTPILCPS